MMTKCDSCVATVMDVANAEQKKIDCAKNSLCAREIESMINDIKPLAPAKAATEAILACIKRGEMKEKCVLFEAVMEFTGANQK